LKRCHHRGTCYPESLAALVFTLNLVAVVSLACYQIHAHNPQMEFIDFMFWKLIVLAILAFIYGFVTHFTGR
jgi:hypothetical protein